MTLLPVREPRVRPGRTAEPIPRRDAPRPVVQRFPSWLVIGFILLQAAWVLAIPPFRGIDEFDHAYRATAVARGQWVAPPENATRGTGAFLDVPPEIVSAAAAECWRLTYTRPVDCSPQADRPGGLVSVASGAGRYHPAFYALVGTPALPFDGTAALYVMRTMTCLFSAGLLVMALAATRRWARTRWPFLAIATATTPVAVYSTTVVAPNGVEIMAGAALWTALIGLRVSDAAARDRVLIATAAISSVVLVTVRSLGPLWCLMIGLTVLLATPHRLKVLKAMARSRPLVIGMGTTVVATLASLGWILSMRSLVVGADGVGGVSLATGLLRALESIPLWVFQSIAAFPIRNEQAPTLVYATALVLGGGLLGSALVRARRHERRAMFFVAVAGLSLPVVITAMTIGDYGIAWQGRYGLPFTVGLFLLAGYALDKRGKEPSWRLIAPSLVLYVLTQSVGPTDVVIMERLASPQALTGAWLTPHPAIIAVLAGVGALLVWLDAGRRTSQEPT